MAGAKIALTGVAGELQQDASGNARFNAPLTAIQAGLLRQAYLRDAALARENRITAEGEIYAATSRLMFKMDLNGATVINSQFNQNLTTLTSALTAGFLRLNSALVTTLNSGISFVSWRLFQIEDGSALRLKGIIRTTNGAIANKVFEFGFGYYDVAVNQAAVMNEFMGFRWTSAGGLIGVLEYTTGGAPASLTVNINGGVPYSDAVGREYEVVVTQYGVEFWVNGVYQAEIVRQPDAANIVKASGYPIIIRQFHTTAPASAPALDIGSLSVQRLGFEADQSFAARQALMGRHSSQGQQGLTGTTGNTALIQASGTAPTSATGSNVATVITGLGGYYRMNGASFNVAAHSNIIVCSYQNPVLPEAAGTASDGRNLVITDLIISPLTISTALVGGPAAWAWFAAAGSTALSLATADAVGGTTIGTKSPRMTPLPILDVATAAQAVSTAVARSGASSISLATPIVVNPGDFFHIGIRILSLTAITAGVFDGVIGVSGYWD